MKRLSLPVFKGNLLVRVTHFHVMVNAYHSDNLEIWSENSVLRAITIWMRLPIDKS